MRENIVPTIPDEALEGVDANRYLVRTVRIEKPYVDFSVGRQGTWENPPIYAAAYMNIVFIIEDLLPLKRGGSEYNRIKYESLCERGFGSLEELRRWAGKLRIREYDTLTRADLCEKIKLHLKL